MLEDRTEHEHDQTSSRYECRLNGEVVGRRIRRDDGLLLHESGWKDGRPHGWRRFWDDSGFLESDVLMVNGREHGVARQWNEGRLIGWYVMDHGTGVDLWRDADGSLAEERYCKDGMWHGFERWWSFDGKARVWWEKHFYEDVQHGIERQWMHGDRLSRGYPRYYVHGRRVTRRQYLRAAAKDPTLPPYRPADDRPEQTLPPEYFETMPPAVPPRMPANPEEWTP